MEEVPAQENAYDSNQGVMKIDVTPESPLIAQQPHEAQPTSNRGNGAGKAGRGKRLSILIAAIALIAIAAVLIGIKPPHVIHTTTIATTTIQSVNASLITQCTAINTPGSYYLEKDINTSISSGACITVNANNVNLVCNGNKITGSGPYTNVSPYTYGIKVTNKSNITISGCYVKDFSYGVYLNDVSFASIVDSNASRNYMNNIYISNTTKSRVSNNYISYAAGTTGSVYVSQDSHQNSIDNNTILYNRYYGIYIGSGNNNYSNNYINGTPYSFYCRGAYGLKNSSTGSSNVCYNNEGCGFISCKGENIPTNLSQIYLPNEIRSCGSIASRGTYYLESNLAMNDYVNTSNHLLVEYDIPCITVASGNVTLDCNFKTISNATYAAIAAKDENNVTIENCNIADSSFGVLSSNVSGMRIFNSSIRSGIVGLAFENMTGGLVSNLHSSSNAYGVYIENSNGGLFNNFNVSHNNVGIYITGSIGNSFSGGLAQNNTKLDVYAAANSQSAGYNLMQTTTCTYTNAAWATCAEHVSPSLAYKPIISCTTITKPGNYSMLGNIYNAPNGCLTIDARNVVLNCGGHTITSAQTGQGTGIKLTGSSNVTLLGCNVNSFNTSVYAKGSSLLLLKGINSSDASYGLVLSGITNSSIIGSHIINPSIAGVYLDNSSDNELSSINVTGGGVALMINNSKSNGIYNNFASGSTVGMLIEGISGNNTVSNNIMQRSASTDYECVGNSGANAELGGINYGTTKKGCAWLAALTQSNPNVACAGINQPSSISLSFDGTYPYGYKCFGIYANDTTIDCNGHTVIATSGGTFADFVNSQGSKIEDCVLKGFTNPIVAANSSVSVLNDTIIANSTGSTGVNITGSYGPAVEHSNVSAYTGISVSNSKNGVIANNVAGGGAIAYALDNSTGFKVNGNIALQSSAIAFMLNGSVFNTFQDNNFESVGGIDCEYKAAGAYNNTDLGGNMCISNQNCKWVTSSGCG